MYSEGKQFAFIKFRSPGQLKWLAKMSLNLYQTEIKSNLAGITIFTGVLLRCNF